MLAMQSTQATRNQYLAQQRIQREVLRDVRRIWSRMGGEWSSSFDRISPDLVGAVSEAQLKMATTTTAYLHDFLEEVDLRDTPVAAVNERQLTGFSSDGYPLESLLYGSVVTARETAAEKGLTAPQSLREGLAWLGPVVSSQIADVGRSVTAMGTSTRENLSGYTRFLNPPSCSRCAVLAGRVYRYSTGFKRHPKCFPAGTVVSGPAVLGATRRWYEGELVILRSASGKKLSATGNHPVLTGRGWVPANLLVEGDEMVSRASGDRAVALTVPDEDQVPALIEDVWRSGRMASLRRVPVAPEDFHGDGVGSSHVDAVLSDRLLWNGVKTSVSKHPGEQFLSLAPVLPISLPHLGSHDKFLVGGLLPPAAGMSSLGLLEPVTRPHLRSPDEASFTVAADDDFGFSESAPHQFPGVASPFGDGVFALSREVSGDDPSIIDRLPFDSRWDAPGAPLSPENSGAYASRGLDLLDRLSGQVHLDRLVAVERIQWFGHVYDLTSSEGWFDADGFIVSNCDCLMQPAAGVEWAKSEGFVLDPTADLSVVKDLTQAQRAAIDAGADFNQVINANRGMKTVGEGVRRRQITLSGTSNRGVYGRAEIARNGEITRDAARKQGAVTNYRLTRSATPRLTPQQIMQQARNRDELIEYLRKYKYIYR